MTRVGGVLDAASSAAAEMGAQQDTAKLKTAARQFEALLITQLLRTARGSEGGWLGAGEDQSAASALEMAEEQFAEALSASGGMGLASMVVDGIKPR